MRIQFRSWKDWKRSENVRGCISDRLIRAAWHHLVWETVDNAIDEALNGFGKKITITLEKCGAVCVEDEGRGDADRHACQRCSDDSGYFTVLHAAASFPPKEGIRPPAVCTASALGRQRFKRRVE